MKDIELKEVDLAILKDASKLEQFNQQHVLNFWRELGPEQKKSFLRQIQNLDFELFNVIQDISLKEQNAGIPFDELKPFPTIPLPKTLDEMERYQKMLQLGEELLRFGIVGIILVAGGQGTRLGFDGPKGTMPIGPVTLRTIFQYHVEKIVALEKCHKVKIPLYIMTSELNLQQTKEYFIKNQFFAKDPSTIIFFSQGMLPAFDEDKRVLLEEKHKLCLTPDGHGGLVKALKKNDLISDMKRRGLQLLYYFQVDNVLAQICDPAFLGYHQQEEAEMSAKTVYKRDPHEKLGNICLLNGRCTVIEYTELAKELKEACDTNGRLLFGQGSIAIHIFKLSFLQRLCESTISLPYHIAHKKMAYINGSGERREPKHPNAYKLEQFIFDAFTFARKVMVLETERSRDFSPVKNREGEDSPFSAQRDLCELFASWLDYSGVKLRRNANGQLLHKIEISPLFAMTPDDLISNLKKPIEFTNDILLE